MVKYKKVFYRSFMAINFSNRQQEGSSFDTLKPLFRNSDNFENYKRFEKAIEELPEFSDAYNEFKESRYSHNEDRVHCMLILKWEKIENYGGIRKQKDGTPFLSDVHNKFETIPRVQIIEVVERYARKMGNLSIEERAVFLLLSARLKTEISLSSITDPIDFFWSILLFPDFFSNYKQAENFFSWWLWEFWKTGQKYFNDPKSPLWTFLIEKFSHIHSIKKKFNSFNKRVQPKRVLSPQERVKRNNIELINEDDLQILKNFSDEQTIEPLCDFQEKLKEWEWSDSGIIKFISSKRKQFTLKYSRNNIPNVLNEMMNKKDLMGIYLILRENDLRWTKLRKIEKFLIQNLNSFQSDQLFFAWLIAAYALKWFQREESINIFKQTSQIILSFPQFLNSVNPKIQNEFFWVFFEIFKNRDEIKDFGSSLWEYILKHFWDIKLIPHYYSQLIKYGEHRLNATSSKFNKHEESIEVLKVAMELEVQAELKNGKISLSNIPDIPNGHNLHAVVYKRSAKWNLSHPQFFHIAPGWEDISLDSQFDNGRYSIVVFSHYSQQTYEAQAQLPKEFHDMKPKFVRAEKNKETEKSTKEKKPQQATIKVRKPHKIDIESESVEEIEKTSPQEDAVMAYNPQEIQINNNTITFIYWWSSDGDDEIPNWEVIFSISWEVILLSSFFGDEDYLFHDAEVWSYLQELAKEKLSNFRDKQDIEASKELQGVDKKRKFELMENVPRSFRTAHDFIVAATPEELIHTIQWENYPIWTLPTSDSVLWSIKKSMKQLWFDMEFKKWDRNEIIEIIINNEAIFYPMQSFHYGNIPVEWEKLEWKIETYRTLIEYGIALLTYNQFRSSKNTQRQRTLWRINKRVNKMRDDRGSLREQTMKRIDNGEGRIVDHWSYSEKNIGRTDLPILNESILGREWFIRIWRWKVKSSTLYWQYQIIVEELEEHSDFVEYVFQRFYETINSDDAGKNTTNTTIRQFKSRAISVLMTNDEKRAFCLDVIYSLRDKDIPIELIRPIEFIPSELIHEKEVD